MIIHDLEFFNSCAQQHQKSDAAIKGGASASSYVSTGTSGNSVYATGEAAIQGDISNAVVRTDAKIVNNPAYTSGYGSGYAGGYGVDRYDSVATTASTGTTIV